MLDRAVMKLTSLVINLDDKIVPHLIDGEQTVLARYDQAIAASSPSSTEYPVLTAQRAALVQRIEAMKARAGQAS
ncbi:MAG: hypothetical protein MZV49_07865 [Rhodopseudomonas palustris]|nr:hypothetical protein [Rhodopseudomonas palustris]